MLPDKAACYWISLFVHFVNTLDQQKCMYRTFTTQIYLMVLVVENVFSVCQTTMTVMLPITECSLHTWLLCIYVWISYSKWSPFGPTILKEFVVNLCRYEMSFFVSFLKNIVYLYIITYLIHQACVILYVLWPNSNLLWLINRVLFSYIFFYNLPCEMAPSITFSNS